MILHELYEKYKKSEYGVAKEPWLNLTIYACFLHITSFLSTVKNSPTKNGEMG